jgi:hypothetical protein
MACVEMRAHFREKVATPRTRILASAPKKGARIAVTTRTYIIAIVLVGVVGGDLRGQSAESEQSRGAWALHAGVITYGTGDDRNCGTGAGLGGGAELRTRGAWLAAVGLDLLLAGPFACTNVGLSTRFRGEWVDVSSGTLLFGAPRVRVRGGRALDLAGLVVETAAGAGLIFSRTDFVGQESWLLNGWFGGTIALRGSFPVGIEAEYGRHQVPIRYYRYDERWEVVHQFRRWKPFFRLSLVL